MTTQPQPPATGHRVGHGERETEQRRANAQRQQDWRDRRKSGTDPDPLANNVRHEHVRARGAASLWLSAVLAQADLLDDDSTRASWQATPTEPHERVTAADLNYPAPFAYTPGIELAIEARIRRTCGTIGPFPEEPPPAAWWAYHERRKARARTKHARRLAQQQRRQTA